MIYSFNRLYLRIFAEYFYYISIRSCAIIIIFKSVFLLKLKIMLNILLLGCVAVACAFEFKANEVYQHWSSIACSGIGIFTSVCYFIGCCL